MHESSSKLKVVMGLDTLFVDSLCDALRKNKRGRGMKKTNTLILVQHPFAKSAIFSTALPTKHRE